MAKRQVKGVVQLGRWESRAEAKARGRELQMGEVPFGWTPLGWIGHLEHMIEACEGVRPDKAEEYRRWIAIIRERLAAC